MSLSQPSPLSWSFAMHLGVMQAGFSCLFSPQVCIVLFQYGSLIIKLTNYSSSDCGRCPHRCCWDGCATKNHIIQRSLYHGFRRFGGASIFFPGFHRHGVSTPFASQIISFVQLAFSSGQHTYSENPRITILLRLIGVLGLAGLGLCIAGGVLGIQATANQNLATILRRAGVCLYAGMYVILFMVHIGTWTYRWHLRSYRRNVSYIILTFKCHL